MENWICETCGVQTDPSDDPPTTCAICDDERQYVGSKGQRWTTLSLLSQSGRRSEVKEMEEDLFGIGVEPSFAIGHRGLVIVCESGVVLFDPPGFVDSAAIAAVESHGGLIGVAASHPHFYGVISEWSLAFDNAPIFIPEADSRWVQRHDGELRFWSDHLSITDGVDLVQCGGHFAGSSVMYWRDGAAGRGALLTGDTISVAADRRFATFMRSYPNQIPLPEAAIRHIVQTTDPYPFERLYGGFWDSVITTNAKQAVWTSAERYIAWITGARDPNL